MGSQDNRLIFEAYERQYVEVYAWSLAKFNDGCLMIGQGLTLVPTLPFHSKKLNYHSIYQYCANLGFRSGVYTSMISSAGTDTSPEAWVDEVSQWFPNFIRESKRFETVMESIKETGKFKTAEGYSWYRLRTYQSGHGDLNSEIVLLGIRDAKQKAAEDLNQHLGDEDILGIKDMFKEL
ncbi:MAG: hypothetical protein EBU90_20435 [Proteobacteria bacterium]|nr:hypothetical protein [Pseudomonadota bacterium]